MKNYIMLLLIFLSFSACQMGSQQTNSTKHHLSSQATIQQCTQNIQHFQQRYQTAKAGGKVSCGGDFKAKECGYYFAYRVAANLDSLTKAATINKDLQINGKPNPFGNIGTYQIINEKMGLDFSLEVDSLTSYYLKGIKEDNLKSLGMKFGK